MKCRFAGRLRLLAALDFPQYGRDGGLRSRPHFTKNSQNPTTYGHVIVANDHGNSRHRISASDRVIPGRIAAPPGRREFAEYEGRLSADELVAVVARFDQSRNRTPANGEQRQRCGSGHVLLFEHSANFRDRVAGL